MKQLLLLIVLFLFSYGKSKSQDSVTVTFRLYMQYPNGTSVFEDAFQEGLFPFPFITGNFADLGATGQQDQQDVPLSNYSLETILFESFNSVSTINPNEINFEIKFPLIAVGQELKFSFGIYDFLIPYMFYGDDINLYPDNSPHSSCFTSSPELDLLFAQNNINSTGIVRTITIPPVDAIYSYCWSSCLQCNGDSPGIVSEENIIRTRTFIDLNNNSVFDSEEPKVQGINVQINTSPIPINGYTGNNGTFSTYLPDGNYTVQVVLPNRFNTTNAIQDVTLLNNDVNLLFPLTLAPDFFEIEAVFNPALMVAGFNQTSFIEIQNTGNTVSNLSLTITLPNNQSFVSSIPAPTNVSGSVLTYLIPSIDVYDNFPISITTYLPPPPTFMPGDEITWNLNLSPLPNEESDANNIFSYTLPILSSYDPNDKTMMKGSSLTPALVNEGEDFHYRIRFQNTGNFPASFIHVRDTLEAGLNASTLRMLSASHEYSLTVTNGVYLDWFFPNIQLPDSASDPEGSQGYILFSIQPILPVAEGTQIENTAHIYFDFNPAIITNTEVTRIETPLSASLSSAYENVWVNSHLELHIQNPNDFTQLNVYSLDGRILYNSKPTNYLDLKSINANELVVIELTGNNKRVVLRQALIKE